MKKRKILAVLTCMAMLLTIIPAISVNAMTIEDFNQRLVSFKSEKYAHGSRYQDDKGSTIGWQCFGFANLISEYIFGTFPTSAANGTGARSGWTITYSNSSGFDIGKIAVGDVLRFNAGSYDHSVFITGVSGDTVYYADANSHQSKYGEQYVCYNCSKSKYEFNTLLKKKLAKNSGYYGWIAHNVNSPVKIDIVTDSRYPTPFKCRIASTSKTDVKAYSSVEGAYLGHIYPDDTCVIQEVYTNGWCKLTCPWSDGTTKTVYTYTSAFINTGSYQISSKTAPKYAVTYYRSDMSQNVGWIDIGDNITLVAENGDKTQIVYPADSGKRCAWVYTSEINSVSVNVDTRYPTPFKCRIISTSNSEVEAYSGIGGSYIGHIYANDTCVIQEVYTNGWCKLTCPWSDGTTKTVYTYTSAFINTGSFNIVKMSAPQYSETYYRSDLSQSVGWINTGDEITLVAESGGSVQIVYPADVGLRCGWVPKAMLQKTYAISYNANGGTGAPAGQTKNHGINISLSASVPSRTGYRFVGWNTAAGGTGKFYGSEDIYSENADVTLYAQWEINKYTVIFNDFDGTTLKTQTVEYGKSAVAPNSPNRPGYRFEEWSPNYSFINSNIIITAKYSLILAESVKLNKETLSLTVGETETLTASIYPDDVLDKTVTWSSSNPSIASVNGGRIEAIKPGTAKITVTTANGGKTASCVVNIEEKIKHSADITMGRISAKAGETVVIPVLISGNPGIAGFNLTVTYDRTKLTPVSVKGGSMLPGSVTSNIQQGGDMGSYDFVTAYWDNPSNITADGELLSLSFKVDEDASEGEIPVTVTCGSGDVTNQDYEEIGLNITNGAVNVVKVLMGDVLSDGEVNTKDGVRLRQYLAKWNIVLDSSEKSAADVFKDGEINTKDGVKLRQYLAKWDVSLEADTAALAGSENGRVTFEVGSASANPGEYVDIPVVITENTGVAGFNLKLNFDKTVLTPQSIAIGNMLPGSITSNIQQGGDMKLYDYVTAYWDNPTNVSAEGTAFTVRFKVNENAEKDSYIVLSYGSGDICDQNYDEPDVTAVNGKVKVYDLSEATAYTVNYLKTDILSGNTVYAKANVTKNTDRDGADAVIIGVYKDGVLVDMLFLEAEFAQGQTVSAGGMVKVPEGGIVKAFVWDSLDDMKPLSNTVSM